ncbi:hypothetical protein N2152v2_005874 [Parachlorella kessleri]
MAASLDILHYKQWRSLSTSTLLKTQAASCAGSEGYLPPKEALLEALQEQGLQRESIRLAGEEVEDEEMWEDILDESDDPWMRSPAALEDTLSSAALLLPSEGAPPQGVPDGSEGESPYAVAASGSMTWHAFQQLRNAERECQQEGGGAGSDQAVTWAVLDVRKQPAGVAAPAGCVAVPLEQLTKEAVQQLGACRLAVLATEGNVRAQQACVRLRSVFGYSDTVLVTDWHA